MTRPTGPKKQRASNPDRSTRSTPMDRAKERAERRESYLDAAIAVITVEGPGASMEAIAQAAGVSKPILYRHFGDREGLIEALAERFVGELADRLGDILTSRGEPVELLRRSIATYVETIEEDPSLYRFLTSRLPPRGSAMSTLVDRLAAVIARTLAEGLRSVGLDTSSARPWSYGIVGAVHLAGDDWVARPSTPRTELVDELTRLLWSGMSGAFEGMGEFDGRSVRK
ncbi:MAG: TetR/AcrR family transcriptional regulator [Actinobacteria bacterium]|nr:TetR/AcrR family transcriptional regulator [Actinomycetota bacterium]